MNHSNKKCKACDQPVSEVIDGDVGERVLYFSCRACKRVFYPGWPEQAWEDPDTRPLPEEIETFLEATGIQNDEGAESIERGVPKIPYPSNCSDSISRCTIGPAKLALLQKDSSAA